MPNEFELIRSVNQRLLSEIARKREESVERIQDLNSQMAELRKLLEQLDYQRSQIEAAEKLQAAFLSSDKFSPKHQDADAQQQDEQPEISDADESDKGKLKARIGDQRYIVLSTFREQGGLSLNGAIFVTGLPAKRVKDSIRADLELGVLREDQYFTSNGAESVYSLTAIGKDLLDRFEAYKKQKGQKLPTKIEVLRDLGLEPPQELDSPPPPNSIEDYGFTRALAPDEHPTHFFGAEDSDTERDHQDLRETGY